MLTAEVLEQAQQLLDSGTSKAAAADELGIRRDTLRRAVWDGRLREEQAAPPSVGTDKSERSLQDAEAAEGLGHTACTRGGERMLAALGAINGATTRFAHCRGVSFGGVLCALGALLSNGLLGPSKELLGKISEVGLFTERSEITVKHQTTIELEQKVRDKIASLINKKSNVQDIGHRSIDPEDVSDRVDELTDFLIPPPAPSDDATS